MKKLVLFLLLIPSVTLAHDEWSKTDYTLEGTYYALHTIDWLQTRYIAKHPDRYYEGVNPVLGKHPSTLRVDLWFLTTSITQPILANALPSNLRKLWILSGATIEFCMVKKNLGIGLRIPL